MCIERNRYLLFWTARGLQIVLPNSTTPALTCEVGLVHWTISPRPQSHLGGIATRHHLFVGQKLSQNLDPLPGHPGGEPHNDSNRPADHQHTYQCFQAAKYSRFPREQHVTVSQGRIGRQRKVKCRRLIWKKTARSIEQTPPRYFDEVQHDEHRDYRDRQTSVVEESEVPTGPGFETDQAPTEGENSGGVSGDSGRNQSRGVNEVKERVLLHLARQSG